MPPLDDAGFEACYLQVFPLVLAKCRRMLRGHSDATDVAQEVFVRLWRHRELVQDPQALTAWLYQTSTRLVIDRARRRTLGEESVRHLRTLMLSSQASSEERVIGRQQLDALVSGVPKQELEAAILSRFDRLTHPEIAEVMNVGERTVRRLLDRFDERSRSFEETPQ